MHPDAGLELHCNSCPPNHSKRRGTHLGGEFRWRPSEIGQSDNSLKEAIWSFFFTCAKYVTGKKGNSEEFQKCGWGSLVVSADYFELFGKGGLRKARLALD